MAALGAGAFFAGRHFAEKLSLNQPGFMPATLLTVRGIAAYLCTLASWTGAMIAAMFLYLAFTL
jgi:hypothetical protein